MTVNNRNMNCALTASLVLLLLSSLPSNSQTSTTETEGLAGIGESPNNNSSSTSSPPVRMATDQEVVAKCGLALDQVSELHTVYNLSNEAIVQIPHSQLRPLLWRLTHPKVDLHAEALKFRKLKLQDENGKIPTNSWINAAEQKKRMATSSKALRNSQGGSIMPEIAGIESSGWTWLGPGNVGGRIRSILIHPTTPNTMWVGGVSGGVWKTTDGGASWHPLDDFMANLGISCMVMDPTDPNVIYAGTGEVFQGAGIFKTIDGGTSWVQLPSTVSSSFYSVGRLAIDPVNSQIILAATTTGIYRTSNAGGSWNLQKAKPGPYAAGFSDVAFDPGNGSKCIASGYSEAMLMFSTDAGVTWTTASGISDAGTVEVAYAPSNPSIVYASVNKNGGELYRSLDGGKTYNLMNTGNLFFVEGDNHNQGDYDNCLWIDPTNPNIVVLGGINLWRSTDGGATFTSMSLGYTIHSDQHIIVNHPAFDGVDNRTVFFGNDGGIFSVNNVYTASTSGGWENLNNNLGITQFYGAAGNATSGTVIGGAQDNGTVRYTPLGGTEGWTSMDGGDGGFCASDPSNANYFYGEYVNLQIYRSTDGGASADYIDSGIVDAGDNANANFTAPFILDPNNANTMLAGGRDLWRSVNVKATTPSWASIKSSTGQNINAIAVAQGSSDLIWVGQNDGNVYATLNGTTLNPSWQQMDRNTPGLPRRMCTRIAIDPNNANQVYVTFGGFSSGNVWRTTDGGTTWSDISHNLPQVPVNSLVIGPHTSSYLYVGTEVGVFASTDSGTTWSPINDGPANVAVDELSWVGNTLLAATFGRGCFSIKPVFWVQYGLSDSGNGTYERPYNTLAQATSAVQTDGTILFKYPGSTPEKPRLARSMTIGAVGGPATIGR